jgi:hypothetical protein
LGSYIHIDTTTAIFGSGAALATLLTSFAFGKGCSRTKNKGNRNVVRAVLEPKKIRYSAKKYMVPDFLTLSRDHGGEEEDDDFGVEFHGGH